MNEGRPYLKTWRGAWVSFCKIVIVSFLSVGYKSDGLYCRVARTPSSPTLFSTPSVPKYLSFYKFPQVTTYGAKWVNPHSKICLHTQFKMIVMKRKWKPLHYLYLYSYKNGVDDDGVPTILQYRTSDLYLTDRKETMTILQKHSRTSLHLCR